MPVAPDVPVGGSISETQRSNDPALSRTRQRWPSRRLALGLSPTPRSGLVLLLVGMGLGPHGVGIISDSALTSLHPAVSMALATLGVLVGLGVSWRLRQERRLLAAATIESGVTILAVMAAAALVLSRSAQGPVPWLLALMLGVCAASSSSPTRDVTEDAPGPIGRIGDLDDLLPIVLSVAAIGWTRSATPPAVVAFLAQAVAIGVTIAAAAWFLLTVTASETEQRVLVLGTLLLLGGAAAHLSISALLIGLVAALFWNVVGGAARDCVMRDARYLQHPLMVLLLIVAGAHLHYQTELPTLAAAYVAFRMAGKLIGGWAASRFERALPRDVGLSLTAPGVIGIAIALNLYQAGGASVPSTTLLLVVATASLALELLSMLTPDPGDRP